MIFPPLEIQGESIQFILISKARMVANDIGNKVTQTVVKQSNYKYQLGRFHLLKD